MSESNDKKSLVVNEANNALQKLTEEYSLSPTYSCIQMGAYCFAQVAAIYQTKNKKIPKDLVKFLEITYPKLLEEQDNLIKEQTLMLNVKGTA